MVRRRPATIAAIAANWWDTPRNAGFFLGVVPFLIALRVVTMIDFDEIPVF
jgi:hypothetical protein